MPKKLEIFDKKIIVLYILDEAKKSLNINQIMQFIEDFDDITYFDIIDYIQNLEKLNFISKDGDIENKTYSLTDEGKTVLNELLELIPGINLYKLKKVITQNLPELKKESSIGTKITPCKNDSFKVSCYINDGNDELLNLSLYASDKETAKKIIHIWQENYNKIYLDILEEFKM